MGKHRILVGLLGTVIAAPLLGGVLPAAAQEAPAVVAAVLPAVIRSAPAATSSRVLPEPWVGFPPGPRPEVVDLGVSSISPQTATYGTGILVTLRFDRPVPLKARKAVLKHLKVKSSKKLGQSGWAWQDAQTAVFRPRHFWPGNAKVEVIARPDVTHSLGNAKTADGTSAPLVWVGAFNQKFRTGRSQVITVNGQSHQATVVRNGKKIRTMPVSLGMSGWETRSGVKVLTDKYRVKQMTSESIGAPDEYVLQVPYAIRLTASGEFMHGAPWATGRIGRWNGSHGCTNLMMGDASWLFNSRLYGDPVVTKGTNRSMTASNGMGGPWNVPWKLWAKGRMY